MKIAFPYIIVLYCRVVNFESNRKSNPYTNKFNCVIERKSNDQNEEVELKSKLPIV